MSNDKKTKANKKLKKTILIGVPIILLGTLAVFAYLILCNSGFVLKKSSSTEVMDKLKDIEGKGGKFELTQKDMYELSDLFKPKTKGNLMINGLNIEIVNGEVLIKAPISYNRFKKVNLLFSSKGKLDFSDGKITYVPYNFKIGKLTLPKKLVMSQILKYKNKIFYVENNSIKTNPNVIPVRLTSIKIRDNKILVIAAKPDTIMSKEDLNNASVNEIDKQLDIIKQKIQSATGFMNNEEKAKADEILASINGVKGKSITEKKKVISNINNVLNEETKLATNSEKKKQLAKISTEVSKVQMVTEEKGKKSQEKTEANRASLAKAKKGLSEAYVEVKTAKEQQVISKLQSTVGKMETNQSYDSTSDKVSIKSSYSTLNSASKDRVKYALFTNVDQKNIRQLKQIFGL
ncbi:hypothetical protein LGK95_19125 [Clostridium algoriphilum]|uniref:hypothetical protein n=1 Tax=Clostridium algoriphilum TaxID=198347 RepID=UPI001CF2FEA6|nr:hypothetical protein [Clostridium algoriphilum]MCB2295595.1 hypothetical protein [Clostridium algoriphilum]